MVFYKYVKEYICHPYRDDPEGNVEKVLGIVEEITEENKKAVLEAKANERISDNLESPYPIHSVLIVPVAVHLLFPRFMSEETFGRNIAMAFCISVLQGCDRIRVCGPKITDGMRQEITYSGENCIEITWRYFD